MTYSENTIKSLLEHAESVPKQALNIQETYAARAFDNEKALEYAQHGFCRRIAIISHCLERVFTLIPPTQRVQPASVDLKDAEICIQAMMVNIHGCVDNLAWVWTLEKNIQNNKGNPIHRNDIGLRERNRDVRKSFSREFQAYLTSRDKWFEYLVNFRDALAHRIPLYISPFAVDPDNEQLYNELEAKKLRSLGEGSTEDFDEIEQRQNALTYFRPVMLHSFSEDGREVLFHSQIISDFLTVEELGRKLLEELDK